MSEQRLRLAKYLHQRQFYHATFCEIRHDDHDHPQVLLTDIYPVHPDGHKIPLRSKYHLTDQHGHQIAAAHLWTPLNANFLKVAYELLYGDQIQFSAVVQTYPIARDNVVQTRNQLWQQNRNDRQKIYQLYQEHVNDLYKAMTSEKQKAYKAYRKRLLTFDEMKAAQKRTDKDFQRIRKQDYRKCTHKIAVKRKRVEKLISNIPLLDYSLVNVDNVTVIKPNRHFNLQVRYQYDKTRVTDVRYTKFLAAHSICAHNDNLSAWNDKDD